MNKMETRYSQTLELLLKAGEIQHWSFESVKLRLADQTFYTPDFLVIDDEGQIQFHETKGFMRTAARVRLNVAADIHWWAYFFLVKADGQRWDIKPVP